MTTLSVNMIEHRCPPCGGHIPMQWFKMWCKCPNCNQVWRVVQTPARTFWYYPEIGKDEHANT